MFTALLPPSPQTLTCRPADVFDPDRFIDGRVKKYLIPNPSIFLPFNAGPRVCLGQQVRLPSNPLLTSHADLTHPMLLPSLLTTRCLSSSSGCCRTSTRSPLTRMHNHRERRVCLSGRQRDERLRETYLQSISPSLRRLALTHACVDSYLMRLSQDGIWVRMNEAPAPE